jgi:hypothetical protein
MFGLWEICEGLKLQNNSGNKRRNKNKEIIMLLSSLVFELFASGNWKGGRKVWR